MNQWVLRVIWAVCGVSTITSDKALFGLSIHLCPLASCPGNSLMVNLKAVSVLSLRNSLYPCRCIPAQTLNVAVIWGCEPADGRSLFLCLWCHAFQISKQIFMRTLVIVMFEVAFIHSWSTWFLDFPGQCIWKATYKLKRMVYIVDVVITNYITSYNPLSPLTC